MDKVNHFAKLLSHYIIESPKKCLFAAFIFLLVSGYGITLIKANFSVKLWLHPEDQRMKNLETHERRFGSSETMDIIIETDDSIFQKENIELIQELTEEMWNIKDVVRVESISNFNSIETEEDDITVSYTHLTLPTIE